MHSNMKMADAMASTTKVYSSSISCLINIVRAQIYNKFIAGILLSLTD